MGWTTEELWLDSWQWWEIFPFSKVLRPSLWPTILLFSEYWGLVPPGVKTSDIEARYLPLSTAKDMNVWSHASTYFTWCWLIS